MDLSSAVGRLCLKSSSLSSATYPDDRPTDARSPLILLRNPDLGAVLESFSDVLLLVGGAAQPEE
jgi:hypothetical protein